MSGTVAGPDGPIGAATVTITDGRVSLQTSTVSPGAEGTPARGASPGCPPRAPTWSRPPRRASPRRRRWSRWGGRHREHRPDPGHRGRTGDRHGHRAERTGPACAACCAVRLDHRAVRRRHHHPHVDDGDHRPGRTVRATLDLPTPGEYTVTVSGDGYQDQVQHVSLAEGVGSAVVDVAMVRVDGAVSGTVFGKPGQWGQARRGRADRRRADPDRPAGLDQDDVHLTRPARSGSPASNPGSTCCPDRCSADCPPR